MAATSTQPATRATGRQTARIAGLMLFTAATLAIMSTIHLGGTLGRPSKGFEPNDAGIAEAIIGIVLVLAAARYWRTGGRSRAIAIAADTFAIAGFLVGLRFTIRGGDAFDLAYHATMLPVLLLTLALLARSGGRARSDN